MYDGLNTLLNFVEKKEKYMLMLVGIFGVFLFLKKLYYLYSTHDNIEFFLIHKNNSKNEKILKQKQIKKSSERNILAPN